MNKNEFMEKEYGISKEICVFIDECEKECEPYFKKAEEIASFNQIKVMKAFYDNRVSEAHFGRSEADAPDFDGKVYFMAPSRIVPGCMIDVKVREVLDYDLYGRAVMPKE